MNEKCPFCGKEIDYSEIFRSFMSGVWDYAITFEMECPHCEEDLDVEVESIPEFHYSKPDKRTMK